jgi:thioredoxin reductase (NADPH)
MPHPINPVLITVDDEPQVLRAIDRDLRRQYGEDYRILRAESGEAALEALSELKKRNETVALFLVDQRMPGMSGIDFLARATEFFPRAKRVLLTAYADTEVAIKAINSTRIDYYLIKPWEPPEERLYPVLSDLLEDWRADYRPPFDGIRVLGHRWSNEAFAIKDFLARNRVPYQWLDVESGEEAQRLRAQIGAAEEPLPLVLFGDGTHLAAPSIRDLADRAGLRTRAAAPFYDLAIAGAGPAGLAAAVYAASEGLRTVILELQAPGGQAGASSRIENYLGFPSGITGTDLARRAADQARRFGAEILTPAEVVGLRAPGPARYAVLADGSEVGCHAVLIATGVSYRRLDVPGIDALVGLGVYYGATVTEAMAHSDKDVYIVGGANSAGQAALFLAASGSAVTLAVRGPDLAARMPQYLVDRILADPRIDVRVATEVTMLEGHIALERITLTHRPTGNEESRACRGLFCFIGAEPATAWLTRVALDRGGFIRTDAQLTADDLGVTWSGLGRSPLPFETNIPAVFAAGDVRSGSIKRVAAAVGEGASAVSSVHRAIGVLS